MKPERFSLGISGHGLLLPPFLKLLKTEFPGVIIYDRKVEQNSPPSAVPIPSHPEVSDVDAVFSLSSTTETVLVRSRKGHKFFNFASTPNRHDRSGLQIICRRMVQAVSELL